MEKKLALDFGFGAEYSNKYLVVINGVKVVRSSVALTPCKRLFLSLSVEKCDYIELCYQYSDGSFHVIDYRN